MTDLMWAAMQLAEHPDVCDALMRGQPVPRGRLRPGMLAAIDEPPTGDDVVLTEELALRCEVSLNGNPGAIEYPREPHSWTPIDLCALDDEPPSPPTIGGLIYPGRRHVISGEPEALKSWGAAVLCVEEVRAGRAVLYVDFEMGHVEMRDRLRALGVTADDLGRFAYVTPAEPMTEPSVLADVERLLATRKPSLAVFDSFTGALSVHGLDPNSGVDVERFYREVAGPIRRGGAAFLVLDHLTKAREGRGKFSIGSERKIGGADVHLGFDVVRPFGRGRTGLAKITTHKDRPGHLARPRAAEFELTSDPDNGLVSWEIRSCETESESGDKPRFRPTELMERVSIYVASQPDPPSRNGVEENVSGKRNYVRLAIDTLLREGFIEEQDGPRNARLLVFVRPYRQSDEHA